MLDRLLPRQIDNTYRGRKAALWLFGLLVLLKIVVALTSVFDGYDVARSADAIPLDTFTPAGARAVVAAFAAWGLAQLVVCLLCVVVLIRYRAAVPFMLALLLLEHLSRRLLFYLMPVAESGTPPGFFVNLILLTMMVAGLALSLWRRERLQTS